VRRFYNDHQTLISRLRRQLLPWGEAGALHGPRASSPARVRARRLAVHRELPSPIRERLSVLSSEISIGFSCFSCFGVEAGKEFMGQRDADDHFGFSFLDEALFEGL
jgi:hypothetical protein